MSSRFARHELIPGWSQDNISGASAVVIGVGAVGNEVARLLAMAGISRMVLCDPDRVEETNLSRTPLFRVSDVGQYKVEAAADALRDLAPGLVIEARAATLVRGLGLAELRDASIILSCLDTRSARLQLAARCALLQVPVIDGGTHPWGGEVRPFLRPDGPCYSCTLSAAVRAEDDSPWSCMAPVLNAPRGAGAFTSAIVGGWMASIALRFLLGLSVPAGLLRIDVSEGTTTIVDMERKDDCLLHRRVGDVTRIGVGTAGTVDQLRAAVGAKGNALLWEPIQERVECPRCAFAEPRWGVPRAARCPNCDRLLRSRTTLDMQSVPGKMTLRDLGIPPREILYVDAPGGEVWVEIDA